MTNEVGETTRSIVRRGDDANQGRAIQAMETGAILHRVPKLRVYAARNGRGDYLSGTSLSEAAVRRLERSGAIIWAGVDTYILNRTGGH